MHVKLGIETYDDKREFERNIDVDKGRYEMTIFRFCMFISKI